MTQFDTRIADGVWDDMAPTPMPRAGTDVRTLVHRAAAPAEHDELVDEPVIVGTMHRPPWARPSPSCRTGRACARWAG